MDTPPIKKQRQSTAPSPPAFIPDELIAEILSWLDVKTILRFKCVSKSWNTLISDPTFTDKHLKKSSQKQNLIIVIFDKDNHNNIHYLEKGCYIAGSCNGLICLFSISFYRRRTVEHADYSIYFWNPSTRKKSEKLGSFRYTTPVDRISHSSNPFKFAFGYDDSSKTYKVVAFHVEENKPSSVKSINWLALRKYFRPSYQYEHITHVEQIVIISLDFSTETYKQLLLPQGFDEVPFIRPIINVLMECLCFSHETKKNDFVLWKMKEYGVQESWTQLFKISYHILQDDYSFDAGFRLACLYKNGDTVVFANAFGYRVIAMIYNLRNKKVDIIRVNDIYTWFSLADVYVESLVAVC